MKSSDYIDGVGLSEMVGRTLARRFECGSYANIVTRTRPELDLLDSAAVRAFLAECRADYSLIAAATTCRDHPIRSPGVRVYEYNESVAMFPGRLSAPDA